MPKKGSPPPLQEELQATFEAAVAARATHYREEALRTKQKLLTKVEHILSGVDTILRWERQADAQQKTGSAMDVLIEREARQRARLEQNPHLPDILAKCSELREALVELMGAEIQALPSSQTESGSSGDPAQLLEKPIAEIDLSCRARKRMVRLDIRTVNDLVRHSADELLDGAKNFGEATLNEVRRKLGIRGLKLRND
ncbi:MAG: DNA-directed RNA polymerase subunit alpha C-terminal domain-containing protein [Candidatus Peribacter sp.]|jgi:DNA-directed RNA polymerase subunit alpha